MSAIYTPFDGAYGPGWDRSRPLSGELAIRRAEQILRAAGVKAKVVRTSPEWKPGDVVIVRYHGLDATSYTYVRGARSWPGEAAPKTDAQIDALYEEGKVTPALQAGGEAFDKGRM